MVTVSLPDGSKREFYAPLTVAQVAASIGAGLAKAALAGKIDGKVVDTSFLIEQDAALAIITDKDPEGLDVIRHSTAHLLAYAVKSLFPDAQVTIGPVIENGFYYDFSYKRPFTPDDLVAIEKKMSQLPGVSCRAIKPLPTLSRSVKLIRQKSSPRFRQTKPSPCTPRVRSRICAADRTCRLPVSSRFSS